jgi:hypothetical protein
MFALQNSLLLQNSVLNHYIAHRTCAFSENRYLLSLFQVAKFRVLHIGEINLNAVNHIASLERYIRRIHDVLADCVNCAVQQNSFVLVGFVGFNFIVIVGFEQLRRRNFDGFSFCRFGVSRAGSRCALIRRRQFDRKLKPKPARFRR